METFNYYLALFVYLFTPPAYLHWLVVHPFIRYWRRIGLARSLSILWGFILLMAVVLFLFRHQALAIHYPVTPYTRVAGIILLLISLYLRYLLEKELQKWVLIGIPELNNEQGADSLTTTGIYSRVRHPRYFEGILLMTGFSLLTNYLALYLITLLYLPVILLVIYFEERELLQRYGEPYRQYMQRVPKLIPRLKG